jgi:hypothetical protein
MIIAAEVQLRYDDQRPAETVAGVNLLSRRHFLMQPQLREPPPLEQRSRSETAPIV